MIRKSFLLSLLVLGFAASPALADKVHLTNGQVLEGKVKKDGKTVVVTTDGGTVTRIDASEVISIDACPTPRERYDERILQLQADDAKSQLELAKWCESVKLAKEARSHYERVVEMDADNAEARKALGYELQGGAWVDKNAEAREHAKDEAAKKAAAIHAAKLLREAAQPAKPEVHQKALAALRSLDDETLRALLIRKVEDGSIDERRLCADLLADYPGDASVIALARRVVCEERPEIQGLAVASLTSHANPDTGILFAKALKLFESPERRIRAAYALKTFPHKAAVPALMSMSTGSGGDDGVHRSYFAALTQRAYISDWELTSGGTAVVVVEVAAPIIQTIQEGVVLEVNARYQLDVSFEEGVRSRALEKATGERKGSMDEWKDWWKKAEADFELSQAAKEQLASLGPALSIEMKKQLALREEAAKKKAKSK